MKLSISGKGGSGKSTLTALLAMELRDRGYRPVIMDADESNSVLYRLLGMENPPEPLVSLAGGRQMVKKLMPPGYKPGSPDEGTHILSQALIDLDELPPENIAEKDGLRLIVVGKIAEPMEGCACPMGVLGREFLGKLKIEDDEFVLADMEAGIEHFGRGVESSIDRVLAVVEPSFESINLAGRIQMMCAEMGMPEAWAVLNKVASDSLASKIKAELARKNVREIGSIPYDEDVFSACLEGRSLSVRSETLTRALHQISDHILASGSG